MPRLPPTPDLEWNEGAPRASAFDDVYFSRGGGLAESEAVFLAGCGLPERWVGRDRFSICELGFGTGLNALAVWRAWKDTREPHAILHMCSIEAFPLAREDAARALSAFPSVAELSERLLARWPVRAYAPQRLWFPEDGFALTLLIGEAEPTLTHCVGAFDAWFLDGFAPARNPAMWTPAVMRQIARLSAPGARLASYSVAGDVRRALESAGFNVERKAGFGAKRERLEARKADADAPHAELTHNGAVYPYAAEHPKRVAILGAGIAGASCAHALAKRHVETIVLDAAPALGAGASGNPAGLVMPRLDREGPLQELFLAAYLDAVATYEALGVFTRTGVDQFSDGDPALADLLGDPPLPPDWFSASARGALHARAGLVTPLAAIAAFLRGAQLMLETEVAAVERAGESWVLRAPDGRALLKADAVILACGAALTAFAPARFLPIARSRGQIEWGPLDAAAPAHAITSSTYAAPLGDGILFGATFDRVDDDDVRTAGSVNHQPDPEVQRALDDARARNLLALTKLAPNLAAGLDTARLNSRAALRAATPDRAPIAGLMPDAPAWLAQHAALAHGGKPAPNIRAPALDGVYVLGGLGARGLTLAPLLAERLASELFGQPQALSGRVLAQIHPARFLHRVLKRGG